MGSVHNQVLRNRRVKIQTKLAREERTDSLSKERPQSMKEKKELSGDGRGQG